jgi:XTP/dITP diphosphohydrolase
MHKIKVRYATSSVFKQQEIAEILAAVDIDDPHGHSLRAGNAFDFEFPSIDTDEPLERDLETMVRYKVRSAYRNIMAPCIVEHAGLVLERFDSLSYPGGLTQPMWDALGAEGFVEGIRWAGTRAIARAVVGYCDGLRIRTFMGETRGTVVSTPRGSRAFYWDPVFCPDDGGDLTYAEISDRDGGGLSRKVGLSQSTKAMKACLRHILSEVSTMFPDMS